MTLLDFSVEVQNSIYMLYNEFLRELNLDLQIYIQNRKMNTESYIDNLKTSILRQENDSFKSFLGSYLADIEEKLNGENIYKLRYYAVISLEQKTDVIAEVDKTFFKLNKIGCVVNRIVGKENLVNLLYESMNKESLK